MGVRLRTPASDRARPCKRPHDLHPLVCSQPYLPWQAQERCRSNRAEEDQKIQHHDEKVSSITRAEMSFAAAANRSSSFFGTQEGEFSLTIKSIKAVSHAPPSYTEIVASDCIEVEHGQADPRPAEVLRRFLRPLPLALLAVHLAALAAFVFMRRC